ncbi:MAG: hypothetical protein OEZ30_10555, partial [Candidatus Aminicenantes bacterium]|nr:hypothetical protein [Candidatus Aminicenantes bacterium]
MTRQQFSIVSVFLVFSLALSGIVFGQRVIDLSKVWGDMRVLGKNAADDSGWALAHGDINGDGFMDIIISADYASPGDPPRTEAGETYVIFGSSLPPSTIDLSTESADITVCGDDAGDYSGIAVASGDINDDGCDDIIIGAHWADPGDPAREDAGETYVIFGSSPSSPVTIDLSTTPADITIFGAAYGYESGFAVASGDVNGDGYADLIIGARYARPGGRINAGETYVIFGSSSPSSNIDLSTDQADITVWGDYAFDMIGEAVASGDVNGDGYDDVIIGTPWYDSAGGSDAGVTYVIFGSSFSSPPYTIDLSTDQADITVLGADTRDYSGWAVASGDVNGDGYDDIIIGADCADPGGRINAGETYVIFGFITPWPVTIDLSTQSADITVCGAVAYDTAGRGVASGDVNGDGYDDVIIGAKEADPGGRSKAGETYVIFGSS